MKDKIIFWLDANLIYFGLAKYIQEKYDCELFALIDVTNKSKRFFTEQKLVQFSKTWYYHDHIKKKFKYDLEYLANFEKKYNINLWLLAFNERLFYNYNDFYKFSVNEILSILERECKLFESVLDETKPDFVIMKTTDLHQHELFHKICKAKRIKILMLKPARFGYRSTISEEMDRFDNIEDFINTAGPTRTLEELQKYLKGHNFFDKINEFVEMFATSKLDLIKASIEFLFTSNTNTKTHYSYYGRTKFRVIINEIRNRLQRYFRQLFIDKNLVKKIDTDTPSIYFPLHMEIESVLLIGSPFYTNQIEIIKHIAKSLPMGYKLYVKDAPANKVRYWLPISFYKQIMKLPNVKLIHPSVKPEEILNKCSLVVSISGTSAMEAAFYGKQSIIFTETDYSILSSVYKLKTIEELPQAIRSSLKKEVDLSQLNKFVNFVDQNSFEFDLLGFTTTYSRRFYYNGFLVDVDINEDAMKSYLEDYRLQFEMLAIEHIKKITQHKESQSKNHLK